MSNSSENSSNSESASDNENDKDYVDILTDILGILFLAQKK